MSGKLPALLASILEMEQDPVVSVPKPPAPKSERCGFCGRDVGEGHSYFCDVHRMKIEAEGHFK